MRKYADKYSSDLINESSMIVSETTPVPAVPEKELRVNRPNKRRRFSSDEPTKKTRMQSPEPSRTSTSLPLPESIDSLDEVTLADEPVDSPLHPEEHDSFDEVVDILDSLKYVFPSKLQNSFIIRATCCKHSKTIYEKELCHQLVDEGNVLVHIISDEAHLLE